MAEASIGDRLREVAGAGNGGSRKPGMVAVTCNGGRSW